MAEFNYRVGPQGGTLEVLSLYAERVRLLEEGTVGKVGDNVRIPGRGGSLPVPLKQYDEGTITLEVIFRYTNSAGVVTHGDGPAGHVYENKANVDRLFDGQFGLVTVRRDVPDWGEVETYGEVVSDVRMGPHQWFMHYEMLLPTPTWRSTTLNGSGVSPLTIGGSARVQDAEVVFAGGASSPVFTHTLSGATISYIGSVPAGGVRVFPYLGSAERVTGGADESANVSFNRDYGLILVPGSNAFTGAATVEWHDQWKAG